MTAAVLRFLALRHGSSERLSTTSFRRTTMSGLLTISTTTTTSNSRRHAAAVVVVVSPSSSRLLSCCCRRRPLVRTDNNNNSISRAIITAPDHHHCWSVNNHCNNNSIIIRPLRSSRSLSSLSATASCYSWDSSSSCRRAVNSKQHHQRFQSTTTTTTTTTSSTVELPLQLQECLQQEQQPVSDETKAAAVGAREVDAEDDEDDPLERAQSILKLMQESNEYTEKDMNQYRESLIKAWLERQEAALLLTQVVVSRLDPDEKEEGSYVVVVVDEDNKNDKIISQNNKAHYHQKQTQQQQLLLRQAVHATKVAHELLQAMEPRLAPHHYHHNVISLEAQDGNSRITQEEGGLDELNDFLESSSSSSLFSKDSSSNDGSSSSSSPQESIGNNSDDDTVDMIAKYGQAVLKAWAGVLESAATIDDVGQESSSSDHHHHHFHRPRSMRGIPQRAQFLLERMLAIGLFDRKKRNVADNSSGEIASATECYNAVLQSWAYSHEHLRGVMAERVFQEMSGSSSLASVKPNGDSYRLIIRAWSWSRDRRAAFTATGHLMKMLRKLERSCTNDFTDDMNDDLEPTLEDYHVLLQAWTRAEDKMSPQKAQSVPRLMEHSLDKGYTTVRPDMDCYLYVLQTCAQRPLLVDLGRSVVNEVFQQLENDLMIPNAACYDAAICVWKNCALHPDADEWRQESVEKTLELLQEMRSSSQKASFSSTEEEEMGDRRGSGITTENINHVLEALTVSSDPRRTEQAESLLKEMEDNLTNAGRRKAGAPTPNADSYRHVIQVWKNTTDPNRLDCSKAILSRMKDHVVADGQEEDNNKNRGKKRSRHKNNNTPMAAATPVDVLNAFIHHCASFSIAESSNPQEHGMLLVREALMAVTTFQSTSIHPNAASYTAILQAARNLLPPGPGRQLVVEQVFQLACDNGMVNEFVLRELLAVATSEQYTRLVLAHSQAMAGTSETRIVPEEWTRNAFGDSKNNKGRVLSADGRRSRPLAVDGQVKMTKAMQDFKMRRLRDKRNRNLLRGGRWDRSQDDEIGTKNTNASASASSSK